MDLSGNNKNKITGKKYQPVMSVTGLNDQGLYNKASSWGLPDNEVSQWSEIKIKQCLVLIIFFTQLYFKSTEMLILESSYGLYQNQLDKYKLKALHTSYIIHMYYMKI